MKKFTPLLSLGLLATAMSAGAQATFEKSATDFWTTHRTAACMGDFTNNDKLDIFYGGQDNNRFSDPVGWWWQIQQNFCTNNGDGTFAIDGLDYTERQEEEEGEMKTYYDRVWAQHGVRPSSFNQYAALDYNNDGLLDLLLFGRSEWDIFLNDDEKGDDYLLLYKNLGGGKFELETNAVFPKMRPDNNSKNFSLAVGDYDRDGYVDFLVSATEIEREENYPGRTVSLYRNLNGTGQFQDMKIAETIGDVWTNEVKDGDNVIVEKQKLDGYFLPCSGNVHFADLNNDGWLDIIYDGWADNNWDGVHQGGNTGKIYINQNGEKFVDATPMTPAFYTLRSSGSSIADVDGDGYLDYFITGASGCHLYYGSMTGTFNKVEGLPGYSDGFAAVGDVTGNGLSDIFMCGYGNDGAMAELYLNTTNAEVEAPAVPTNVSATVEDGVLTITWDYDDVNDVAFNVYVKNAEGKVYTTVPANIETGFVKVGYGRTVALRPSLRSYSIAAAEGNYTVGVQAISTYNETYSTFATATTSTDGLRALAADAAKLDVKVNGNSVIVSGEGEVAVYNALGAKVAAGVAGQAINVAGKGVYMVTLNGKSAKIVK